jgi:hypothetical protein
MILRVLDSRRSGRSLQAQEPSPSPSPSPEFAISISFAEPYPTPPLRTTRELINGLKDEDVEKALKRSNRAFRWLEGR